MTLNGVAVILRYLAERVTFESKVHCTLKFQSFRHCYANTELVGTFTFWPLNTIHNNKATTADSGQGNTAELLWKQSKFFDR